ncbi:G2/mitotic-specific cyclin-2-like [Salvia miltiorrhiza]|uniref:G2/mitotic-specific cyclin-2-like n=1 Tax=Salvia miltiorrhiza TaxID=226208 RepID=UPI0025AB79F5|nr:G2/mitotic-specific cyclin-2-like [Salvia miltiorrhiza]
MVISNQNNIVVPIRPTNVRGGGHNRRALSVINHELGEANPPCYVAKKRGFTKAEGVCNNGAAHRPMTRNSAAEMAVQQQPTVEEAKKLKTSAHELAVFEDIALTDVDDHEPVPMSLEHSEIEMRDKNQMEEVEMEDIFEETSTDIDGCDANNPLAVVDYVEDLYAYYKKMEGASHVSPEYMSQQVDINERMRAILIDWLIEVHHKFDLRKETLFLTVNLIDRFLAKQSVVRKELQLIGLVAMLLACKYEEVAVPVVEDLVFISDKAYNKKQVLEMEKLMLNTLQFNMSVPTTYVFMLRFLKAAQSDSELELLSFFLIELCLVEYEMLKYPPSLLAAAAIYTAQCTLHGVAQWSKTCEGHTSYSQDQLLGCSRMIVGFHQKAATGKLTGVHRKYNTSKFGYAARCKPAEFLVQ